MFIPPRRLPAFLAACQCGRAASWRAIRYRRSVVGVGPPIAGVSYSRKRVASALRPISEIGKLLRNYCMLLDWTNWTFWVTSIALVAFGFFLRDIYEQWRFRKGRKDVRDEFREVDELTRQLEAATERLNKANAKAEGARSRPE